MADAKEDCFVVRMYDCRPDGPIKINALMQYLQEAAACHAEELGLGIRDLEQRGCFWVLVNLRLEVTRTPRWGDRVLVTTWPSGCTRLIAAREFVGRTPDGEESFRASSDWMILDRQTGRPKNLDRLDLNLPRSGSRALSTAPARLQPAGEYAKACTLRVPFSALDFNGHVNNTEYVRWALDAVHGTFGGMQEIRTIQLTYMAEVFEGDEIELLVSSDGDDSTGVCIRKSGDGAGVSAFVMEIIRQKRQSLSS